ncbi:hypothetical protein CONLIGDRAFT_249746 [Coniochaeta ligniaria NRRL 30616]|uniref:DUF7730 domain-containing protein n=1 Tax=Coniochaeta ligniaria NRRL 30616 TaxID=1408157 RepID=A0A1J7IWZ3_9PEZI|nr:hypothetical protein CONLIGDRAFT_249746 [Coniochaeta ligniaria NRRL 30616]
MEARRRKRLLQRSLLSGTPEEGTEQFESWNRNQKTSPLLRLPPEIRNRVYELVLSVGIISVHHRPVAHRWHVSNRAGRHEIIPGGFYCRRFDAAQNPWVDKRNGSTNAEEYGMTLLAPVCRQLYHETSLLPFQLNAWCFESVRIMERYVIREKRLAREQRRAIRTLYIDTRFTKAIHKCFSDLEVLIWFSRWTGMRKTVLPASQSNTRVVQVRSRPGGQPMELFDT